MKISFMTFACPEWNADAVIDGAVRHGYHGIEFRTDANHQHGVEVTADASQRKRIRRRLADAGVEPCCLATSLQFATDKVLEESPARIELAASIGCPGLRVFCGPAPEGMEEQQIIETVAEQLRVGAEQAQAAGVELWLETHDTFSKAAPAGAAVRRADRPSLGINYDNMHPYRNGEPLETTVAALGDLVRHTHFHDSVAEPDTVVITPLDKGSLPMDDMFKVLINMGYDGYLSGEWFGQMYGEDADESLANFHRDMTTLAERNGVRLAR